MLLVPDGRISRIIRWESTIPDGIAGTATLTPLTNMLKSVNEEIDLPFSVGRISLGKIP
jgi:hypothetical protein